MKKKKGEKGREKGEEGNILTFEELMDMNFGCRIRTFLILFFSILCVRATFIAYDCNRHSNKTRISLTGIDDCPPPSQIAEPKKAIIQVLQSKDYVEVLVRACLVRVQKRLFRCGMWSHSVEVLDAREDFMYELGVAGCNDVHRKLQFEYQGVLIGNLKPNSTTASHELTLAGKLDAEGNFEGVPSYVHHGRSYGKAVVTAIIQVTLTDYRATVDVSNNKFALRSGLQCTFTEGSCADFEIGETSWTPVMPQKCNAHYYDVLYEGESSLITSPDVTRKYDTCIIVQSDNRIFALKLTKETMICGQMMWKTDHPALLEWINEGLGFYFQRQTVNPKNVRLDLHISSLLIYSEPTTKTNLQKLHLHNVFERCSLERRILENQLILARIAPHYRGSFHNRRIRLYWQVDGETLFIMNGDQALVKLRKSDICYEQLPILSKNSSQIFMEPFSRVISTHGVEIDCNPLIAPIYRVDGKLIQLTSQVHPVGEPGRLAPRSDMSLNFDSLEDFTKSGIYTADEIQSLSRSFHFPKERDAISNMLAMSIAGLNVTMQGCPPPFFYITFSVSRAILSI